MSQVSNTPGRLLQVSCPCDLAAIGPVAKSVRSFLEQQGLSSGQINDWELVLAEAGNNAVRYVDEANRHHPVEFAVEVTSALVELRVRDHTPGFDFPDTVELPDPLSEHGRGLFLMRHYSDSVEYLRGRHSNCLVIRRQRADTPGGAGQEGGSVATAELEATLQTMTEELVATYESLSAIFRFTEDLARGGVNPAFVERWLSKLKSITGAEWFVLRLMDSESKTLRVYQSLPPGLALDPLSLPPSSTPDLPVELAAAVQHLDVWIDENRPLAPTDPLHRIGPVLSGFAHPMNVSGELMGVVTMGFYGGSRGFTSGQVSIVQTLADFLAIQVRDAQYEQARLQARLLDRDYEVASNIQRSLLPKHHPTIGNWISHGYCQSAQRVGGDFYDVLPVGPSTLLLAIADVMGKGLPAALFATIFRTLLRARQDLAQHPGEFLGWLNRHLAPDLAELEMFITAQLAYVDLQRREIRIAGAGHPPLLLAGQGVPATEIFSAGPPLGILEEAEFQETQRRLPSSTRLLMYTDGMTEIATGDGGQLGVRPLLRVLDEAVARRLGAPAINTNLVNLQRSTTGDQPAADDCTLLLLVEELR